MRSEIASEIGVGLELRCLSDGSVAALGAAGKTGRRDDMTCVTLRRRGALGHKKIRLGN